MKITIDYNGEGNLNLRRCAALTSLPDGLKVG